MELSDLGVQRAISIGIALCAIGAVIAAVRLATAVFRKR